MRSRNIKPSFFKNEDLAQLPMQTRLLFIGLWCMADREGRLEDRPLRVRAEIYPYEPVDVDAMLDQLAPKFILRYEVKGKRYIQILQVAKHQQPHYKEAPSTIPPQKGHVDSQYIGGGVAESLRKTILDRDGRKCLTCGSKSNLTIDHIKPRVLGGTNDESNLQTLCKKCNAAKNNRVASQGRANVESTLTQARPKQSASFPLIPDSGFLLPDSLIPDSKKTGAVAPEISFESIWDRYPRKLGKENARKFFKAQVRTAQDYEDIQRALVNFKGELKKNETEEKFIPHGSTWFNHRWRDYVTGASNGTNGGKGTVSYLAILRKQKEAEALREQLTPREISDRRGDLQDVPTDPRGAGRNGIGEAGLHVAGIRGDPMEKEQDRREDT